MSGYYQTLVETPKGNAYIIDAKHGGSILKEGKPDLDKITAQIVIPNEANMNYEIISTEYIDVENIIIAPSKGNLTRDINPSSIPYSYSQEYQENRFWYKKIEKNGFVNTAFYLLRHKEYDIYEIKK